MSEMIASVVAAMLWIIVFGLFFILALFFATPLALMLTGVVVVGLTSLIDERM